MKKIVYIIPGHEESFNKEKGYRYIAKLFKEEDYQVYPIKINWKIKEHNFDNFVDQFQKQIVHHKPADQVVVLGYSFGAMIALNSAAIVRPNMVILCSLSPFYFENYKNIKPSWLNWWKKHFSNEYLFNKQIQSVPSQIYLLYGALEDSSVKRMAWLGRRNFKESKLFIVPKAKHNLHSKFYVAKLGKVIKKIQFDLRLK